SGVVAPMTVKAGDKILFGKYTGSELELDEKLYYVMSEDDVMAVIEEGDSR
ncbi:MAG: co-chaperone GroES, partial [Patescibacteria group bacterium]